MIDDNMYTKEPKYEIGIKIVVNDKLAEIVDIIPGQKGLYYLIHHFGHLSEGTNPLEIQHEMYLRPAPVPKFKIKNRVDILNLDKSVLKRNVRVSDRLFLHGSWMYYIDYNIKGGSTWWAEAELQKHKRKKKS